VDPNSLIAILYGVGADAASVGDQVMEGLAMACVVLTVFIEACVRPAA